MKHGSHQADTSERYVVLTLALGLVFLVTASMGAAFLIAPEVIGRRLGIAATSPLGLSTLRGDMAAGFLVMATFTLLGSLRRNASMLLVPLTLLALIVTGRLTSVAIDGSGTAAVRFILPEILMLTIVAYGYRVFSRRLASLTSSAPVSR